MSTQEATSLTAQILRATRSGHDKTDKLAQLRSVTALRDARLYRQLLRDFWAVYQSFEAAWSKILQDNRSAADKEHLGRVQEILTNVWMPELARTAAFEVDLEFYYKDDARSLLASNATTSISDNDENDASFDEITIARRALELAEESMSPAAKAYKTHIAEIAITEPIRLLAYAYTMYSAITAGGQILRSRLVKHLLFFTPTDESQSNLPRSALHPEYALNGQQLFDFYPVANVREDAVEDWRLERPIQRKRLRTELKRRLDAFTLSPSEIDTIIDEANYIFANNAKVLSEASDGAGWYLLQWALSWGAITAAVAATTVWLFYIWKR
ncbi:hypothetical protein BDF22DRAFT_684503 [Syncephalis plumigaleata]|nr:hypothetical protein BDF22DRAFT_684503 [Syncephalis plumigaleata]